MSPSWCMRPYWRVMMPTCVSVTTGGLRIPLMAPSCTAVLHTPPRSTMVLCKTPWCTTNTMVHHTTEKCSQHHTTERRHHRAAPARNFQQIQQEVTWPGIQLTGGHPVMVGHLLVQPRRKETRPRIHPTRHKLHPFLISSHLSSGISSRMRDQHFYRHQSNRNCAKT